MINIEHKKVNNLTFDPRPQMGRIYAEGYYDLGFKFISKDKARLAKALAHIFELDCFHAAIEGEEIKSVVACTDGKPPVSLNKKILRQTMGFIHGTVTYMILNKILVKHTYPFEIPPTTGVIEFVAANTEHKGKGVTFGLLTHIMETLPYREYVLEVADTNTAAVRLYEKLGFSEFMRKPSPSPKHSGFNHFVYMKKV